MADHAQLESMDAQQLRELAATLIEKVSRQDNELRYRQARIDQLTHTLLITF
jgi:transposase